MRYRTACTAIAFGMLLGCVALVLALSRSTGDRLPAYDEAVRGHQPTSIANGIALGSVVRPSASTPERLDSETPSLVAAPDVAEFHSAPASTGAGGTLMQRALQAAKGGDLDLLRDLIPRLGSVNSAGPQGTTLLHAAAAYGQLGAVRLLVGEGALVRVTNDRGEVPLHMARGEVAELLISYGADVTERDARGATPLHRSSHDVAVLLIASGADISIRDRAGSTPMLNAIRRGDMPLTKLLISLGADVNHADRRQGVTPLHLAVRRGDAALVALLIGQGADINAEDKFGNTPLSWTRSPLTAGGGKDKKSEVANMLAQYGAH